MELVVFNTNGNGNDTTLTVQSQSIAPLDFYTIPTADLTTWAGDLTFRAYLSTGALWLQDDQGNSMVADGACDLLDAITNGKVGTS